MGNPGLHDWPTRRTNLSVLAFVLAICLSGIVMTGLEVQRRLDVLARANSDSVQWALAQLEVELMRLKVQSAAPDGDPEQLRLRFDIFHGRMKIIRESPLYADLRAIPGFRAPLDRIATFLDATSDSFAPAAPPGVAPPDLSRDLDRVLQDARTMSLIGLDFFARQSDLQRSAVADTLRRMVLLTTGLVVALSALLIVLVRLYGTSRRQSEDIRLTSARLSTIVATSADAIVVSDRTGRLLEFNPAAEAMFGYSRDEALSINAFDLLTDPETARHTVARIDGPSGPDRPGAAFQSRVEVQARRKQGDTFPVELSVATAESLDGAIVMGFLRDISERRQTERDLTEARDRALAGEQAKARFLAVMSHEMRTPLNGLLGSAEILHSTALDPDQARLVEVIDTSAHILLDHVNAGLDISRIEAGAIWTQVIGFCMTTLVSEAVANQRGLAAAAGNSISVVTLGAPTGRLLGNPGQVRQILLNLIGNAVKFTSQGTITVEIEPLARRGDTVEIEIRVIDSGIGIAEEDLGRVFEDYVTLDTSYHRPTGGTGLGLGITQRLVRALGGTIGVESAPGAGSVFWVRLPFVPDPATATDPVPDSGAPARPALSVLVVDDNQINRFVLRSLLEEVGHRVTEAADGQEGVVLADATPHDLILMDISMPGMDGIEATRRIRADSGSSRAARIVAVTAHAHPADQSRFLQAGMQDCLVKPITRGSLSTLLSGGPAPPVQVRHGGSQVLDPDLIDDLAARLDPARLADLLCRFQDEGDSTMARLAAGVPDDEARMLIHRLAGSAATFGATRFAKVLQQAEAALAEDPPDPEGARALAGHWSQARSALSDVFRQPHRAAE